MLVVEDDPASYSALRIILQRRGWHVLVATTMADARRLLDESPAFIILDLMLPDGDGTLLLEKIRAQALPIRVAVTTGSNDPIKLEAVRKLAPDIVLHKPIDLQRLLNSMEIQ